MLTRLPGRLVLAIVTMGLFVSMFACGGGGSATSSVSSSPAAPAISRPASKVTYENFVRVKNGMTSDQVYEILGKNCEVMADSEIAGIRTVMLMWKAEGFTGGNCSVTFQNGRVALKAQAFLPHGPSEPEADPAPAEAPRSSKVETPPPAEEKGVEMSEPPTEPAPVAKERAFRTWTSGKYTTEAQFLSKTAGKVKLKKRDGTVVEVPLDSLSEADQDYIRSGAYKLGQ